MGLSLAFHIVFAVIGIGMPALMVIPEALWLRTGETTYLDLTRRWARGTVILFAIGAISGTVLSFELGLLWPRFMEYAGGIIGVYGWQRVQPVAHWLAGLLVAVSGMVSAVFVATANAWMNAPAGFTLVEGRVTDVDPIGGVPAYVLLGDRTHRFHRRALGIALAMGVVAIPLQVASGHWIARGVSDRQPVKFAALGAIIPRQDTMFDLDHFIAECRTALAERSPEAAIKELVSSVVAEPSQVAAALGTPRHGEIITLHHSPELTVLNVIWTPGMAIYPHDHRMWTVIGLYGGREDNTFYRRSPGGLAVIGGKRLEIRDVAVLGQAVVHSVANPLRVFTGAIHVYGGDFFGTPRSEWTPGTLQERPFDMERARQVYADANERWRVQCGEAAHRPGAPG